MKASYVVLLGVLALAACGKGQDNKPILHKQKETLDKAKQLNGLQQQNTDQQKQAIEQQTQ